MSTRMTKATKPRRTLLAAAALGSLAWASTSAAAPPAPQKAHPRLFMDAARLATYTANAATKGTAAYNFAHRCQDSIDNPNSYKTRDADSDIFPGAAVACAFAYLTTSDAAAKTKYAAQSIKYWTAAMNDVNTLGDAKGCVPGVSTVWKASGSTRPAVIAPVALDTGYPIRWYVPFLSLTYDWMYNAPGVTDDLRKQTQTCLGTWLDWYSNEGYLHDEPGGNYNAGFVTGKALGAIALAGDTGAAGDTLWADAVDNVVGKLMVGQGLAGASGAVGSPAGALLGGDWPEGWQYGPLSVLELATAARALEEAGVTLPDFDAWTNSLMVRYAHGSLPKVSDGTYTGNGDYDETTVFAAPQVNVLDAVLAGPSSDAAAGWAASYKKLATSGKSGSFFYNVLAESRAATAQDFRTQSPAPALWYVARGTRTLYARSSWGEDAFWGVLTSPPRTIVADHLHFGASHFVFSRGSDGLVVDSSRYGENGTLETNAISVESDAVKGEEAPGQLSNGKAELVWARGTTSAVFAARADVTKAFSGSSGTADVPYAHREWVLLPEGEIVTIDRAHTKDSAHNLYVNFHLNTGGKLTFDGTLAKGAAGSSVVAVHPVYLTGGKAVIQAPAVTDCSGKLGTCNNARFKVDQYFVKVPGPWAVAIHVIDGLAATEAPATTSSLTDAALDPQGTNKGVIGAGIYRASKQSYVVASAAQDGAVPTTMTYSVPGGSAARHIVFDAPEAADGQSTVTAAPAGDRCVLTLVAGPGVAGHPAMFQVGPAADGCKVTEDTNVPAGAPPPGGGAMPTPGGSSTGGSKGGPTGGTGSVPGATGGQTGTQPGTGGDTTGLDPGVGSTDGNPSRVPVQNVVGGCACQASSSRFSTSMLSVLSVLLLVVRRRS